MWFISNLVIVSYTAFLLTIGTTHDSPCDKVWDGDYLFYCTSRFAKRLGSPDGQVDVQRTRKYHRFFFSGHILLMGDPTRHRCRSSL